MSLRLFQVRVQPIFLDEDDRVIEAQTLTVPAIDWREVVAENGPLDQQIAQVIAQADQHVPVEPTED